MENMAGLKGKTVLVTGAAGFIGSHLSEQLQIIGAKVIALDVEIKRDSYFVTNNVYKNTTFELVDIRDRESVRTVFEKHLPDYVFHLAAEAIVEDSYNNPTLAFETNIMGTINILDVSRLLKSVQRIIVASSDKAYGKTKEAYTELSPLRGDHPYDVSKSSADLISQTYFKTYGLPVVITRFGNVYGEGDVHFDRIVPGICEAIIKNKPLKIRSNGKYVRDYLYVKDVVDGYIFLAQAPDTIHGEAFNFSSKDTLSVLEMLNLVEKALGKKIKYLIKNNAKNEIPYQHLDDHKIRALGWKNNYNLESSFQKILDWYNLMK